MRTFLTDNANDLDVIGDSLKVVAGSSAIALLAKHYAQTIRGEMIHAASDGVRYKETVFDSLRLALFEMDMRQRLLQVNGVQAITSFKAWIAGEELRYDVALSTTHGEVALKKERARDKYRYEPAVLVSDVYTPVALVSTAYESAALVSTLYPIEAEPDGMGLSIAGTDVLFKQVVLRPDPGEGEMALTIAATALKFGSNTTEVDPATDHEMSLSIAATALKFGSAKTFVDPATDHEMSLSIAATALKFYKARVDVEGETDHEMTLTISATGVNFYDTKA